jgi:hypothetical protein
MILPTSNLPVSTIITVLGTIRAKFIFRNIDNSLRTINELWAIVNIWGLSFYCPGTTFATKSSNLINDRRLSYFKGYNHTLSPMSGNDILVEAAGGTFDININCILSDYSWYYYNKTVSWITVNSPHSGTGTGFLKINVSSNLGPLRTGFITIRGEPKYYVPGGFFEITVKVDQVQGQV